MNDRFRISRKEQIVPSEEKDKFTNNEKIYNTLNKYGIKQKDIADIERNFGVKFLGSLVGFIEKNRNIKPKDVQYLVNSILYREFEYEEIPKIRIVKELWDKENWTKFKSKVERFENPKENKVIPSTQDIGELFGLLLKNKSYHIFIEQQTHSIFAPIEEKMNLIDEDGGVKSDRKQKLKFLRSQLKKWERFGQDEARSFEFFLKRIEGNNDEALKLLDRTRLNQRSTSPIQLLEKIQIQQKAIEGTIDMDAYRRMMGMFKEQMLKTATDDIDNYYNSFIDGEYEKIYKIVANNGGDAEVTKKLLEKVGSKTLEKKGGLNGLLGLAWEDNEAYNLLITVMPDIENFFNEFKIKQSLFKNNYYKLREYAIGKRNEHSITGYPVGLKVFQTWLDSHMRDLSILEDLGESKKQFDEFYEKREYQETADKDKLTEDVVETIAFEAYGKYFDVSKYMSPNTGKVILSEMPEYLKYYSRADIIKYLIRKYKKSQTPENLKLLEYFAKRAYLADDTYGEPDGKWDNRIANYLYSLKSDPSFNAGSYLADIEFILQGKAVPTPLNCAYSSLEDIQKGIEKSYQTVAEEIVNSGLWNFDTTSPYSLYKVTPRYKRDISEHYVPTTSGETEKFNFILTNSENGKLDKSIQLLTDNEIEKTIPRTPYLEAIKKFLKEQELPEELKKDPLLAEKILESENGTFDDPNLEALRKAWFEGGNKGIIAEYREKIAALIKLQSGETALGVREGLLEGYMKEKCGFTIEYLESKNPEEFRFQDVNNKGIVYRFKPLTGEIFVEKQGIFDKGNKQMILSGEGAISLELVAEVPPYGIFLNQVSVSESLPKGRLESFEALSNEIGENISGMMTYSFGTLEASQISDNILRSRYSGKIIQNTKKILGVEEDISSEKDQKIEQSGDVERYNLLVPIMNTINNSSGEDLKEISDFLGKIATAIEQGGSSYPEKSVFCYFDKRDLLQGKQIKRDETLIGILLSSLEMDIGGDSLDLNRGCSLTPEERVLNIDKIKYLNTMENQTDPEVLEWFDGLKNRLSSFHQSTVQKDKDDLAQREAEYIKSENEELLKLEEEIDKQIV